MVLTVGVKIISKDDDTEIKSQQISYVKENE